MTPGEYERVWGEYALNGFRLAKEVIPDLTDLI